MPSLQEQLVKYLTDAHSLEQHVARQIDTQLSTTEDPEMKAALEQHKRETELHKQRLEQRLGAHDASPSTVKEAGQLFAAVGAAATNLVRKDNAGKNARDAFVAEHMEIASYELLERVARMAGDNETADVAQRNRADEVAMAGKIASMWDRAATESLRQEGVDITEAASRIPGGSAA